MIKIPIEQIYEKIQEKEDLTKEQIDEKIEAKLKQLSGLISREGAAHIIANELGIKLFDAVSGRLQIKNIMAGMKSVETVGRVKQVYPLKEFQTEQRSGKVCNFILADETGFIRIVGWGDQADSIAKLQINDVIRIKGGYVRENQGRKEVHINEKAVLSVNPSDEQVAELKEQTPLRKDIKSLQEGDENVEILATLVQAYPPNFFERTTPNGPQQSFVMNGLLDDGTEDMRTAFFAEQVLQLTGQTQEQILALKENAESFDAIKTQILGKIVKIKGRMTKNKMFDRLEMVAQHVDPNPNPDDELKKLNEAVEKAQQGN